MLFEVGKMIKTSYRFQIMVLSVTSLLTSIIFPIAFFNNQIAFAQFPFVPQQQPSSSLPSSAPSSPSETTSPAIAVPLVPPSLQQQQQPSSTISNNNSNVSSILSSLLNFKPTPDMPAVEKGFLLYNGTNFEFSYPSNWKKIPYLGKYTGVESTPIVGLVSKENIHMPTPEANVVITMNVIGNRLLSDYAQEEISALQGRVGFKLDQSTPTTLANNTAQKIIYTFSLVHNGAVVGTGKVMEIVTINEGTAYFFQYFSTKEKDFLTLLPIVDKMVKSFKFKPVPFFLP
jgi:hypothetical protein